MRKLMKYLPSYYEEVKEINYLLSAEEPEINNLWNALEKVKNNQFIEDADAVTIRKWEKLLNIYPDNTKTLEYRRAVIIMSLSTRAPLTYRWLSNWLKGLVGEDKFDITLDYNKYSLYVLLIDDFSNFIDAVKAYLRKKAPANLLLYSGTENSGEPAIVNIFGFGFPSICMTTLPPASWSYEYIGKINIVTNCNMSISVTMLPEI